MTAQRALSVSPLTAKAFSPYGEVIEADPARQHGINDGTCQRFHDLAEVDVLQQDGRPLLNIFRAQARELPLTIEALERHPLSSQAFMPIAGRRFLVVVAPPGEAPSAESVRAFLATGGQGVNYRRGTWHHPLIALDQRSDFVVIDRGGPEENCDVVTLSQPLIISALSSAT